MKQKVNNNSPVTKTELSEVLKNYPTKKDLRKELSNYPTKKDLDDRFSKFYKAFSAETDHKLSAMEERLNTKLSEFSNRILTAIDPLVKELETRREDREIATAQMQRIEDDVDNIKQRVTQLEHS